MEEAKFKKLKTGYTTGSTTAAACKGATKRLFNNSYLDHVVIDTPIGKRLRIDCFLEKADDKEVVVRCQKDYSDDPDVTKGINIYVKATKAIEPGIHISTGEGIGIVTLEGLSVPVGQAAINPVPKQMILSEVNKVLPFGEGVNLHIRIPEGVEIAKKTFNSKLGIIGGISILGTTGIVEPMSEDAYTDSLRLELHMNTLKDKETMVFVFGNFGLDYLDGLVTRNMPSSCKGSFPRHKSQKISNFVKLMMEAAYEFQIKKILFVGHSGKMVKVAHGMKNTHSKHGDYRMESLYESCKKYNSISKEMILNCNTTDEAVAYIKSLGLLNSVFDDVARRCKTVCQEFSNHKVEVECLVFTKLEATIGQTQNALKLLEEIIDD